MGKITFCGASVTKYSIQCGESESQKHAADVLNHYLEKINGEALCGGEGIINLLINEEGLGTDGYRICNMPGKLDIIGANERGLLYGVYGLLEKYLGLRIFVPGLEIFGEGGDIPEIDESFSPVFEYRQSDWPDLRDPDWCVANHINNYSLTDGKYGGYVKWGGNFVHSMWSITGCPRDQQPCLSDPAVLEQAIAYTRNILENDPKVSIISISQNDNLNFCTCPRCAAVDEEEGSHMGTILRFVNAVAENIKDDYPNVAIETLAYRYSRNVPKKTKPLPNVIIRLCSIECCFSHSLSDPTCERNKKFSDDIVEWGKICNRLYVWDYVTNFAYYIPTFPNFGTLRENMRFYAMHGVKGMYPEGNFQSTSGEFGELRGYLLSKLMWDPFMSEKEYQTHIDEFMRAYYGKGWRYIRSYLDLLTSMSKHDHMGIYQNIFFIESRAYQAIHDAVELWWDKAEELAGDRIEAVKRSRLQWTYISLSVNPDPKRAEEFYRDVNERNIRWRETLNVIPKEQDFTLPPVKWIFRK